MTLIKYILVKGIRFSLIKNSDFADVNSLWIQLRVSSARHRDGGWEERRALTDAGVCWNRLSGSQWIMD